MTRVRVIGAGANFGAPSKLGRNDLAVGTVADVEDDVARRWIEAGVAEPIAFVRVRAVRDFLQGTRVYSPGDEGTIPGDVARIHADAGALLILGPAEASTPRASRLLGLNHT